MGRLGLILVAAGFLGGALASVLDEAVVPWGWFLPAAAVGFLGVSLVRMSRRRETRAAERLVGHLRTVQDSLGRIARNITQLNAEKQSLDPYDVRHRLEELFADDLSTFLAARESIAHSHGLAAYGEVMNCFAAGERYLNRAWCASADGYIDEIHQALEKATEQFTAGRDRVVALSVAPGPQTDPAAALQPEPD
ncbi:MAG: hypothetical protein FJ280_16610 [Planctomycetes bacterium]|nr:hypothetical protein [Planctomycetota bacterium]